jgi:hypothetical protein
MCILKTRQTYVDDLRNLQITEADCVFVCVCVCVCVCMCVCMYVTYDMYARTYAMHACLYTGIARVH